MKGELNVTLSSEKKREEKEGDFCEKSCISKKEKKGISGEDREEGGGKKAY